MQPIIQALTRGDGIFITSHGGPLSISIDTAGQPQIARVPNNILLIFHTPMQAVVHSNTIQDTELCCRFWSQSNAFKTGMQGGITGVAANCYGTDRFVDPYIETPLAPPDEHEDDEEEEDEEEDDDDDEIPILTAKLRRDAYKTDDEDLPANYNNEKNCVKKDFFINDEEEDEWERFLGRRYSSTEEAGFEYLNHLQAFLPGDEYYSQNQSFDEDSLDFDGYLISPPRQDYRVPDGDVCAVTASFEKLQELFEEETVPYPTVQYEGDWIKIDKDDVTLDRFHAGARRHPYFNRRMFGFSHMNYGTNPPTKDNGSPLAGKTIAEGGSAALPRTTDQMLRYLSAKHAASGKPGLLLVVVNSCSPSKELGKQSISYMKTNLLKLKGEDHEDILSGRRQTQINNMIKNLLDRNSCYWRGRGNFAELRARLPWIASDGHPAASIDICGDRTGRRPNPLLPYWEGDPNAQFTRIDKEDRHATHLFIGELIAMERAFRDRWLQEKMVELGLSSVDQLPGPPPIKFLKDDILFALFTLASCDRRGTIMINLRGKLVNFFGETWWNNFVAAWKARAQVQFKGVVWGGGRKNKRKRKTKRKRRKKIKKSRRRKKRTRRRRKK